MDGKSSILATKANWCGPELIVNPQAKQCSVCGALSKRASSSRCLKCGSTHFTSENQVDVIKEEVVDKEEVVADKQEEVVRKSLPLVVVAPPQITDFMDTTPQKSVESKHHMSARKQLILGCVVQLIILLSSFLLAQYILRNEGGNWHLLAVAIGVVLGGLFGEPISIFVHVTCEWSGTTRAKPSRIAGLISACGLGLMGTGIGAVVSDSGYLAAPYATQVVGVGAFLMVVAFDLLPVVKMNDRQIQILAPHLWDGWSGLAIGAFLFVPALIVSSSSSNNTFVWVAIGTMILAAAVRPVGLMARTLFGVVVRRALEFGSTFGIGKLRPGAVVWTWIDYDSVDEYGDSGKDRPVMIVSSNGSNLQVLPFTTKDHTYRDDVISLGRGSWDVQRRHTYVKVSTLLSVESKKIRRIAGQVDRRRFEMVIKEASRFHPSLVKKKSDGHSFKFSNGMMNSLGLGLLWLVIAILLGEI